MRASHPRTVAHPRLVPAAAAPAAPAVRPLRRRLAGTLAGWVLALAPAACGLSTPATDVTLGQTVIEMTDAVNALREETSTMQAQIDSLRTVVARQDSAIARLSNAAGIPPLPAAP